MEDFRVPVAEILGRPGHHREIKVWRPLPGIENALGRVSPDPVEADLRLESVVEGLLVTGPVRARAELNCARCLGRLRADLELDVCELFVAPGHEAPEEEESYEIEGLEIDLEPMLRDAVALALPLNPICREDCKGLCARCGQDLGRGDCTCTEEDVDPRWAGLSELREKLG